MRGVTVITRDYVKHTFKRNTAVANRDNAKALRRIRRFIFPQLRGKDDKSAMMRIAWKVDFSDFACRSDSHRWQRATAVLQNE